MNATQLNTLEEEFEAILRGKGLPEARISETAVSLSAAVLRRRDADLCHEEDDDAWRRLREQSA